MPTDVMTADEAAKVFDQIENVYVGETAEMGEGFEPGQVNVVYPNKLPGRKVRVYCTRTGYSSDVLPYMLKSIMAMKWPRDGGPMYSRTPTINPVVGTSYCFLHPDFPDRERVVAAGVGGIRCSKPGPLLSIMHATRHAETRHADSFKIYKGYLADQLESDQREFQRMQMEVMRMQLGQGKAPVQAAMPDGIFRCTYDGCTRFFDSDQGLKIHKSKEQH